MLRIVGDRAHVLIACRQVDAVEALGMGNRAFLAQLIPDRKRIVDPVWIQMVEIGGPVLHGWTLTHALAPSLELDWQLARSAHGAIRPGYRAGEAELGYALQELLNSHDQLHARQVRADAAVDAQAEGGVPVLLAIDDHLIGIPEHFRIAVGSGE